MRERWAGALSPYDVCIAFAGFADEENERGKKAAWFSKRRTSDRTYSAHSSRVVTVVELNNTVLICCAGGRRFWRGRRRSKPEDRPRSASRSRPASPLPRPFRHRSKPPNTTSHGPTQSLPGSARRRCSGGTHAHLPGSAGGLAGTAATDRSARLPRRRATGARRASSAVTSGAHGRRRARRLSAVARTLGPCSTSDWKGKQAIDPTYRLR